MSFLPIAERELRAAARKRSTYRARIWFALLTSLIAAGLLVVGNLMPARRAGGIVFPTLSTLGLLYCLFAGLRRTADCLSEEKREGTLGLLFLTDLRGFDIVAGKLVATSAQTVHGLLAIFPVLATGLVLGGVTVGEFWRTVSVLMSTLFLSLSVGIGVSAMSREASRALVATIGILLLMTAAPQGAGWLVSKFLNDRSALWVSGFSPLAAARSASDIAYRSSRGQFWWSLAAAQLVSLSCLAWASLVLPRSWQERTSRSFEAAAARSQSWTLRSFDPKRRVQLRARLLDRNPMLWLVARKERQRLLAWAFCGSVVLAGIGELLLSWLLAGYTLGLGTVFNIGFALVLKLWVAWQAGATLAEARHTGAVELLLATPLKVDEIIRGHWQALQRIFFWPVVSVLALIIVSGLVSVIHEPTPTPNWLFMPLPIITVFNMATLVLDLVAIAWVGMWMGLSQRNSVQAFARTIVVTMVIPAVIFCLPNVLFDLLWISWARPKLERGFRKIATERFTPSAPALD